jgi:myosin-light-chain kinase
LNKHGHRIKIIDFGLARHFDPSQTLRVLFGTPEFIAPEVISYDEIGHGTDMWSVGVICYVLLSGLSPFMGDNDPETYANVTKAEFDFNDESFDDISSEAKDFISKLLVKDIRYDFFVRNRHEHWGFIFVFFFHLTKQKKTVDGFAVFGTSVVKKATRRHC